MTIEELCVKNLEDALTDMKENKKCHYYIIEELILDLGEKKNIERLFAEIQKITKFYRENDLGSNIKGLLLHLKNYSQHILNVFEELGFDFISIPNTYNSGEILLGTNRNIEYFEFHKNSL